MYLDTQQMVVIVDLITRSTATADAYIALKWDDYRREWVAKWLKEAGHSKGPTVISDE
jgi:hypothetical protein